MLSPLEKITQMLGTEVQPTASMVLPSYHVILKLLETKPTENGTIVSSLKKFIKSGVMTRFTSQFEADFPNHTNQEVFYAIATYLDPSRKNFWNQKFIDCTTHKEALKHIKKNIYDILAVPQTSETVSVSFSNKLI